MSRMRSSPSKGRPMEVGPDRELAEHRRIQIVREARSKGERDRSSRDRQRRDLGETADHGDRPGNDDSRPHHERHVWRVDSVAAPAFDDL